MTETSFATVSKSVFHTTVQQSEILLKCRTEHVDAQGEHLSFVVRVDGELLRVHESLLIRRLLVEDAVPPLGRFARASVDLFSSSCRWGALDHVCCSQWRHTPALSWRHVYKWICIIVVIVAHRLTSRTFCPTSHSRDVYSAASWACVLIPWRIVVGSCLKD